uniref:Uncharacterized protein n=1 Tax=Oryza sativa subsp. japonica TaxID=39947 RepID=Q6Z7H6_ORYSJ|nr:hypothetical protein [Oryza sativa Japonica Group]BAD15807.1 hypothetical protein [Oryza sativa Japonica Group]
MEGNVEFVRVYVEYVYNVDYSLGIGVVIVCWIADEHPQSVSRSSCCTDVVEPSSLPPKARSGEPQVGSGELSGVESQPSPPSEARLDEPRARSGKDEAALAFRRGRWRESGGREEGGLHQRWEENGGGGKGELCWW